MSKPSLSDLVSLWRDTLIADAAIAAYCTGTLGKAMSWFVGFDQKNPPTISDAPFCVLIPVGTRPGIMESEFGWTVELDLGINDGTFSDYQSKGAMEMRGAHRIDYLYNLCQDALDGIAASKNISADMITYNVNLDTFPLILAQATIESRFSNTIGAEISL